jgi:hypothetical protein
VDGAELTGLVGTLVGVAVSLLSLAAAYVFYREGSKLQSQASALLTRISEKADSIHGEIHNVTNRTLDAALKTPDINETIREMSRLVTSLQETNSPKLIPQEVEAERRDNQRLIKDLRDQVEQLSHELENTYVYDDRDHIYSSVDASIIIALTSESPRYVTDLQREASKELAATDGSSEFSYHDLVRGRIYALWREQVLEETGNNYYALAAPVAGRAP